VIEDVCSAHLVGFRQLCFDTMVSARVVRKLNDNTGWLVMKRTSKAASVGSSLALTATMMLAGCGGGSTAATSTAVGATATASAARFDPPRPGGIPDKDWSDIVRDSDPSTYRERFAARSNEVNAERCSILYAPLTDDELAAEAAAGVGRAPGSTVDEWMAVMEYVIAAQEANGFGAMRSELCSALPSPAASEAPGADDGTAPAAAVEVKGLFKPQIYGWP
jgi:hypothetical protein